MSALAWSALGAGMVLLPGADPVVSRTRALATRGRLAGTAVHNSTWAVPSAQAALVAGSVVAVTVVLLFGGPVLAAGAGIGCATAGCSMVRMQRRRALRRSTGDLLAALRLMSAELESGTIAADALTAAAQVAPKYADAMLTAAHAYRHGHDPPWHEPDLRGLAVAWNVSAVTGAPLAAVVEHVADDLAARNDQRDAVTAAVAGARASAGLLAALPALGLALGVAMQAHPLHVLLGTGSGRVLCLIGVGLDAAGVMWTQRLTSRAEQP